MNAPNEMRGAIISFCGNYRYRLWRYWNPEAAPLCFVMLNPSTADANDDDATIRRCKGFAHMHRAGGIEIVNLFAWRATSPATLRHLHVREKRDIVGRENDDHICTVVHTVCDRGGKIVFGWGAEGAKYPERVEAVKGLVLDAATDYAYAVALTKDGHPRHPLYCSYSEELVELQPSLV